MDFDPAKEKAIVDKAIVDNMTELLSQGQRCLLTVTGSSMLPFLRHERDAVLLAQPGPGDLKRNRIVFFRRQEGCYILHRIRRVLPDGTLVMCGDAQAWTERIGREQVLGAAVAVRRRDGRIRDLSAPVWRLAAALWYPTRPIRPWLISMAVRLRRLFRKKR